MQSPSLAARAARTRDSGETEGLLVAGTAGTVDPVATSPAHPLPGPDRGGRDPEQPARLVERRLEVLRAVLAEIAVRHASRDLDPFAPGVRLFDELGTPVGNVHLLHRRRLLDHERDTRVRLQIRRPARTLARDHPERTITPLLPADRDVRGSIRLEAGERQIDTLGEELLHLLRRHATDLATPGVLRLSQLLAHLNLLSGRRGGDRSRRRPRSAWPSPPRSSRKTARRALPRTCAGLPRRRSGRLSRRCPGGSRSRRGSSGTAALGSRGSRATPPPRPRDRRARAVRPSLRSSRRRSRANPRRGSGTPPAARAAATPSTTRPRPASPRAASSKHSCRPR